jgi:hypothetical protein
MRAALQILAALGAALALAAPAQAGVNRNPAFIQVYDNNVENLETTAEPCRGDWKDLVYAMRVQKPSPDVFTVQQVSGRGQLDRLVGFMNRTLAGRYAGVIAQANPKPFRSPCGAPKARQTNAVIYRIGRFTPVAGSKQTWRSYKIKGGKCVVDPLDRTVGVAIGLDDRISGKRVTAASFHWSTGKSGGPPCAPKNVRTASRHLGADPAAALQLMGGDANVAPSGGRNWYALANGDQGGKLGLRDVTFAACGGDPGCISANWTSGSHSRIDFLFTRSPAGLPLLTRQHTVTFAEGNAAARRVSGGDSPAGYSDHRAVRARIHY